MPDLKFDTVSGSWKGNDYPHVSMTSVAVGHDRPSAYLFMTHMNIDFDGAPNAYGPPEKHPLDSLEDAGRWAANGYYGLMAVDPKHKPPGIKVDERYPDSKGKCPVVQQTGPYAGFYVSTTSKRNPGGSPSQYEQSHYLDSSAVAYSALSYGLESKGVGNGDLGIALRLDKYRTATFNFLGGEGHGKGSANAGAVGECSYRVFLDIGGTPKTSGQKYANNNFPTIFIVFPGSNSSKLLPLSMADNADDLAAFIGIQAHADASHRGSSGLAAFHKYVSDGRKTKPAHMDSIVMALLPFGYAPGLAGVVGGVARAVTAFGAMVP